MEYACAYRISTRIYMLYGRSKISCLSKYQQIVSKHVTKRYIFRQMGASKKHYNLLISWYYACLKYHKRA